MGVFRIARAEFIKIFKKPSVYLMGVILASVMVLSLLFFEPIGKQDYSVQLSGTTVGAVYDKFTNNQDISGGSDIKKSKYDNEITNNIAKIEFYETLSNRVTELNKVNSELSILFGDLQIQLNVENNEQKINETYTSIKNKLNSYNTLYNNISAITASSDFFKTFTTLSLFTNGKSDLQNLTERVNTEQPETFMNIVVNNNYIAKLENAYNNNANFIEATLNTYVEQISSAQNSYYNRVINNSASETVFITLKDQLYSEITNFSTVLNSLAKGKHPLAFISKVEFDNVGNIIAQTKTIIESFDDEKENVTNYKKHSDIVKALHDIALPKKLTAFIETIQNFNVSPTTLKTLKEMVNTKVSELQNGLNKSIVAMNENSTSESTKDIAAINELITSYRTLAINTTKLVDNTINLEITSTLNDSDITKYIGFEDFNTYETTEELTKVSYLINNGVYNHNFSDVFAFNKNSSSKTTAYDFMFYSMEIATLIITIFAIFLSASLMASEYDSGTIKLLAIRPYKRWKIITGKLIATMTFVLLFVLFSAIIGFVAGISLYPLNNTPILAIFNGTHAFAVHPMVLMLINVGCILLEIFFYTVIALSISTTFKSYTAAISVSCIMYLLAVSLNTLFGGALWYSFIPFINADFFKFFGGSFLTLADSTLTSFFAPTLLSNASMFVSVGIYGGTVLIFLILNYILFKVKDF